MRKLRSLPEPRLLAKRGCVTCRASQPGAAVRMLPMPLSSGRARRERSAVPLPGRALSAAARRALPRAPLCRSVLLRHLYFSASLAHPSVVCVFCCARSARCLRAALCHGAACPPAPWGRTRCRVGCRAVRAVLAAQRRANCSAGRQSSASHPASRLGPPWDRLAGRNSHPLPPVPSCSRAPTRRPQTGVAPWGPFLPCPTAARRGGGAVSRPTCACLRGGVAAGSRDG